MFRSGRGNFQNVSTRCYISLHNILSLYLRKVHFTGSVLSVITVSWILAGGVSFCSAGSPSLNSGRPSPFWWRSCRRFTLCWKENTMWTCRWLMWTWTKDVLTPPLLGPLHHFLRATALKHWIGWRPAEKPNLQPTLLRGSFKDTWGMYETQCHLDRVCGTKESSSVSVCSMKLLLCQKY